jgi:phosphoribosylformylglycinamidine (FGAM) synthase-like enzyme
MLKALQWGRRIHSRSVVESGGVIRRLFEMAWGSGLGCEIFIDYHYPLEFLFAELNAGIIFATNQRHYAKMLSFSDFFEIGTVTRSPEITVYHNDCRLFSATPETLSLGWQQTFSEVA